MHLHNKNVCVILGMLSASAKDAAPADQTPTCSRPNRSATSRAHPIDRSPIRQVIGSTLPKSFVFLIKSVEAPGVTLGMLSVNFWRSFRVSNPPGIDASANRFALFH